MVTIDRAALYARLQISTVGRLVHGHLWQSPLARDLGRRHPSAPGVGVENKTMERWLNGERTVPAWVASALLDVLRSRAAEARARADRMETLAALLTAGPTGEFATALMPTDNEMADAKEWLRSSALGPEDLLPAAREMEAATFQLMQTIPTGSLRDLGGRTDLRRRVATVAVMVQAAAELREAERTASPHPMPPRRGGRPKKKTAEKVNPA